MSSLEDRRTLREDTVLLTPLREADAAELAPLLDDPELHRFIGGDPLTRPQLQERYRRLEAGAPPGSGEQWFNWVIRRDADRHAVGTAQATVRGSECVVAWVVARPWQGRGFASRAARALVGWAQSHGLQVAAHIHPQHKASERVARAAGLTMTDKWVDGERVWRTPSPGSG